MWVLFVLFTLIVSFVYQPRAEFEKRIKLDVKQSKPLHASQKYVAV